MASLWDMLGRASSVMQLTGVDAFGMVSMIVQAARTARRNRDLCQQLAKKVEIVSGLLGELHIPELRRHRETRRPLDELRAALFRGYVLVWSCAQQQSRSQFLQMLVADDMAAMLRQAKDEIDSYIILVPLITAVASVKARGSQEVQDEVTNYAAPTPVQRSQLSIQEATDSSSLENELQQSTHQIISPNEEPALPSNWTQEHLSELVLMMVHSAETARHNRDQCQQLAHQALIAGNLIQRPLGTQRPLEQLEDILFRAYMLIDFCSQYSRSQIHLMFSEADMQSVFGLAQEEIGRQIYRRTAGRPVRAGQQGVRFAQQPEKDRVKFHSQPNPGGGPPARSESRAGRGGRTMARDERYDSFKTFSGKLERQLTHLAGAPEVAEEEEEEDGDDAITARRTASMPKVDRFFAALEGPELDKLRP